MSSGLASRQQPTVFRDRGFYKQDGGQNYLFFVAGSLNKWLVGDEDPTLVTNGSFSGLGVQNEVGQLVYFFIFFPTQGEEYCPEEVSAAWQYVADTGEWTVDADARLRCSDCDKYPQAVECGEKCNRKTVLLCGGTNARQGISKDCLAETLGTTFDWAVVVPNSDGDIRHLPIDG